MPDPLSDATMEDMIVDANALFDTECYKRHEMGAEKYGSVRYLEPDNNLFRMLREEFVDAANYSRYLYVRLTIMEQMFNGRQVVSDTPLGGGAVVNPHKKEQE